MSYFQQGVFYEYFENKKGWVRTADIICPQWLAENAHRPIPEYLSLDDLSLDDPIQRRTYIPWECLFKNLLEGGCVPLEFMRRREDGDSNEREYVHFFFVSHLDNKSLPTFHVRAGSPLKRQGQIARLMYVPVHHHKSRIRRTMVLLRLNPCLHNLRAVP